MIKVQWVESYQSDIMAGSYQNDMIMWAEISNVGYLTADFVVNIH